MAHRPTDRTCDLQADQEAPVEQRPLVLSVNERFEGESTPGRSRVHGTFIGLAVVSIAVLGLAAGRRSFLSSENEQALLQRYQISCHTVEPGENCHHHVKWAKEHGIYEHPEWYRHFETSLQPSSGMLEFQQLLHEKHLGDCPRPCPQGQDPAAGPGYCLSAPVGSKCYDRMQWVFRYGIFKYPQWYPGINILSSMHDVQKELHRKNESGCTFPCEEDADPAWALPTPLDATGVCDPKAPIPLQWPSSTWVVLGLQTLSCFEALKEKGFVTESARKQERNWCWVGLKEYGCHNHLYDPLTWPEMTMSAVMNGAVVPAAFSPLLWGTVCDRQELGGKVDWSFEEKSRARDWFRQTVQVYVLSLPQSWQRRATASSCFAKLGISFEFVDGIDMRQPLAMQNAKNEGLVPQSYDLNLGRKIHDDPAQHMADGGSILGTLGCAAGHFRAQKKGLQEQATHRKPLSLVLEDDVCGNEDFKEKLWRLVTQELPCDWQAVSLYSRCPFGRCISPHLTRVQPDTNEPAWRCHHGVNYGMQGMLYKLDQVAALQKVWQPVVFDEKRPHCADVDVALASISDQVAYYAVPASQSPSFLRELPEGSDRWNINKVA
eukprot:TRINITY_DN72005_c0_g1_i1.p1 TRINITY_DN72005_c0_g1~~TRINITY_DN72005_c0_g1_i1.p1  ORF type:complete len:604 (+),score=81.35 TRINITY_DN72005_c0_g1_i1:37-1848(+)